LIVDQNGSTLSSTINQTDFHPGGDTGLVASVTQTGSDNTSTVDQLNRFQTATVLQTGTNGTSDVVQTSGQNIADVTQDGDTNLVEIDQGPRNNDAFVVQNAGSANNTAEISQDAQGLNEGTILQSGTGSGAGIEQSGNARRDVAFIVQGAGADNNGAGIIQTGGPVAGDDSSNSALIDQDGGTGPEGGLAVAHGGCLALQ